VIPDPTLGGAARDVVLDAEALEDLHRAVVHQGGYGDDELALGVPQNLAHPVVEADLLGGGVELLLRDLEGVEAFLSHRSDLPRRPSESRSARGF
jgi:hypothetical protein